MKKSIALFFLGFYSFVNVVYGQWSTDPSINTPICIEFGKQNDPRILEDGKGGAFIVWKDERNGLPDIYLQRINRSGYVLWTINGIAVCDDTTDQSTPNITSDMMGGVIISWSDRRTGIDRDVFAQRVDSNGNKLWTPNGVAIATKVIREHNEKICSDGAGGAYIVWEQEDSIYWDVWAQRVNQNGIVQWSAGGKALCTVRGNRINPKLQKDGKGGAIITWQDKRSGFYDIYAQRVNASGNLLWGNGAKVICNAANTQNNPKIDPSNTTGGAYITWADKRNGTDYDIYLQKVDSNGNIQFATNGISVCNASGSQSAPDILSNKVEGVIICWKDYRAGNSDIYAQRIAANGTIIWAANGVPVCTSPRDQINPNICEDFYGGAIITWQDTNLVNDNDIKAQRISYAGNAMWAANGISIGTAVDIQKSPKNISDGQGGSIFVFQDKRSGSNDIYAHHIFSNGTYLDNTAIENRNEIEIKMYPNPASHFIIIECNTLSHIFIYSLQGNLLLEQEANQTTQIDVSMLSAGSYFVKIINHEGQGVSKKVMIE